MCIQIDIEELNTSVLDEGAKVGRKERLSRLQAESLTREKELIQLSTIKGGGREKCE